MRRKLAITTALLGATVAFSMPASAQGRWDWQGGRDGDTEYRLSGPGVRILFPELRDSRRGRAFVMRNFDANRDGRINRPEANAANRAFAEFAGERRERFDWSRFDRDGGRPGVDDRRDDDDRRGSAHGSWDRNAMRGYGFRQTARGATFAMSEEVLFATDSAVLRPGVIERLRPLAGYLRSERGVRVAIDGHTDSRGTDAHNQGLSERRAQAVRSALEEMSVTRARFQVVGHGESQPVASNATADGMRQNRRVEITLLGRRADEFRR